MKLYTIGFTEKPASGSLTCLPSQGERVVDIRLRPGGQLAGFAKGSDLAWFLERLNGVGYVHLPELAPSAEILDDYRKNHDWERYVARFEALMDERNIPASPRSSVIRASRKLSPLQRSDPGALPPPPRRRASGPVLAQRRGRASDLKGVSCPTQTLPNSPNSLTRSSSG